MCLKLLVLCDQGNNRSVTLAGQLKYLGYDVLTAGLEVNTPETLSYLYDWADHIILTARDQVRRVDHPNAILCDIGPDVFPRPYNKELLKIVKRKLPELQAILEESH